MQNKSGTFIDVDALLERMGNCFMYVCFVLGDESGDNFRAVAIKSLGEEYLKTLWPRLSINQKYHIAMLARVSMFTQRCAVDGFLFDRWEDMSAHARALIVKDCRARIDAFLRVCADVEAARGMGVFEVGADSLNEGTGGASLGAASASTSKEGVAA